MRSAILECLRVGICLYIGVVYGHVLRGWFPAYEEMSFGRKMSYALPALLALLLLLSVLCWLRDLADERN